MTTHFTSNSYLYIRDADGQTALPESDVQKLRDDTARDIARLQKRLMRLDAYLAGKTVQDPDALRI